MIYKLYIKSMLFFCKYKSKIICGTNISCIKNRKLHERGNIPMKSEFYVHCRGD